MKQQVLLEQRSGVVLMEEQRFCVSTINEAFRFSCVHQTKLSTPDAISVEPCVCLCSRVTSGWTCTPGGTAVARPTPPCRDTPASSGRAVTQTHLSAGEPGRSHSGPFVSSVIWTGPGSTRSSWSPALWTRTSTSGTPGQWDPPPPTHTP